MNLPKLELTRDEVGPIAVIPRIPPQISSQPGQGAKSRHEKVGADRGQGVDKKTNILRQLGIRNYLEAVGHDLPDRYRGNLFCPFPDHPGKRGEGNTDSPAFSIFQSDQDGRDLYRCWNPACRGDAGGDVIELHRKLTGEDFENTLRRLSAMISKKSGGRPLRRVTTSEAHDDAQRRYYHHPQAYDDFRDLCMEAIRSRNTHATEAEEYAAGRLCLGVDELTWITDYRSHFYFPPEPQTLLNWIDENPEHRQPFKAFTSHGLGIVWADPRTREGRAIQAKDITGTMEQKTLWMKGTMGTGQLMLLPCPETREYWGDLYVYLAEGSWDALAVKWYRSKIQEQSEQEAPQWTVLGIPSAQAANHAGDFLKSKNAKTLMIYADRDEAGLRVVTTLRSLLPGASVNLCPLPVPGKKDFCECLPELTKRFLP